MLNHTLGESQIVAATKMQPRVEDFQYQCRRCGQFYCRRCESIPEKCSCGERSEGFAVIPVPCSELVKAVMEG